MASGIVEQVSDTMLPAHLALRLGVDYRAESMTQDTADWAVAIAHDLIETIRAQTR